MVMCICFQRRRVRHNASYVSVDSTMGLPFFCLTPPGGTRQNHLFMVRSRVVVNDYRVWIRVRIWDRARVTVRGIVTVRVKVSKELGSV